jgi:acylphosphatase
MDDGRVEAVAQGDEKAVKAFMEDLTTGPTFARVEDIEETVLEPNGSLSAFLIER